MQKTSIGIIIYLLIPVVLFAGDGASFVNLGFSDDSSYFMFGQYGLSSKSIQPYAELSIVDVAKNSFVSQGSFSEKYSEEASAGINAIGTLFRLALKNAATIANYKINPARNGRLLYVLLDGQKPLPSLEFRDFINGNLYNLTLIQQQKKTGSTVSACFTINLTLTSKDGKRTSAVVGKADYYRPGVTDYRIKYIILAPDAKSLVFVIEKTMPTDTGADIRYMVETIKLPL